MLRKPGVTESVPQRLLEGLRRDLLCPVQPRASPTCWAVPECYREWTCSPLSVLGNLGNSFLLSPKVSPMVGDALGKLCYSHSSGKGREIVTVYPSLLFLDGSESGW